MTTIEKIRAEIEQTAKDYDKFDDYRRVRGLWIALEIIDKYNPQEEEWHKTIVEAFEPCEDAVSRQAVLNEFYDMENLYERIKKLPSVRPQEQTGHWIDDTKYGGTECSECGRWFLHATIAKNEIMYCPNCGAKMVVPQESEVNNE